MRLAVARHLQARRSRRPDVFASCPSTLSSTAVVASVVQETATDPVVAPEEQSRSPTSNDVTVA
jgi:hypothetical protein